MSLTRQQLRERAQQVAHAHLNREIATIGHTDNEQAMAALARAWGVEVVEDLPRQLAIVGMTLGYYDAGGCWRVVFTLAGAWTTAKQQIAEAILAAYNRRDSRG